MSKHSFPLSIPPNVELVEETVSGVVPFAPTHARLVHHNVSPQSVEWNARSHRKQRYRAVTPDGDARYAKGMKRKAASFLRIEYWNVSWWVGFLFTLGSIVWVVNGFQVFLPFVSSAPDQKAAAGWTAFVGATIFEVGSVLLVLEAWNRDDAALFGYAIKHSIKNTFQNESEKPTEKDQKLQKWIWFTTDTKYFHEIGFMAAFVQLCGATIFWISGFSGIEQLNSALERRGTGHLDGVFWVPQVVGGSGFIISSLLYMLEAQRKWYIPEFLSLGWHSGFWNFIGGVGFTACGAFGFSTLHWAQYQSTLSTFWGSWAFLIGSLVQWYEAVIPAKHVKEEDEEKALKATSGNDIASSSEENTSGNANAN